MIFIFIFLFLSCHSNKRKDEDGKFVKVYGEVLFLTEKFGNDTLKLRYKIDSVLSANQVSRWQIDSLADAYAKEPKKWAEFFEKVKKYVENKKLNVQEKY